MKPSATLAALLENFFTQRLMNQRQASPHTISSYRDTFRLLLHFAQQRLHKSPARLAFEEIDAPLIAAFLDDLEKSRGITARSRNLRLTAIRSFFQYAAYEEPSCAAQIQRVLAIPGKRHTRALVHFLNRPEIDALLAAPNQETWFGRRDHALLLVAVQTGLRLAELTGLQRREVALGTGAHVRCIGKECHSYCISFRRRNETTIIHACRQACDLAFSLADVLLVVRTGTGLGPYTNARGAGRVGPMSEPYPA
jgi:site-specific recombinase XerD